MSPSTDTVDPLTDPTRSAHQAPQAHPADRADRPAASGRLVAGGMMIGAATLLATAANYLSNLVLGRWLGPEAFADAALVVSGLLLAGALALGFQLTVARAVVIGEGVARVRQARRAAWWLGGVAGGALIVASPALSSLFNTASAWPFAIFGLGLPVFLDQSVGRGIMQADGGFTRLAHSLWIEAVVRLIATAAFVAIGLGATGAALGLLASFLAAHAVAARTLRQASGAPGTTAHTRMSRPGSVVGAGTSAMVVLLIGQVVIVNGDVLVIASRVPAEAGIFAAVALIGRLVFMVSWTVVTVVFPSVAGSGQADDSRLVVRSVAVTAALGAVMTLGAWLAGGTVLALMLGEAYRPGGALLWPYAAATALFSIVNLLAMVDAARGRMGGPLLVFAAAAFHTVGLVLVAPLGASAVVWTRLWFMTLLVVVSGVSWHRQHRGRSSAVVVDPLPSTTSATGIGPAEARS